MRLEKENNQMNVLSSVRGSYGSIDYVAETPNSLRQL